MGSVFSFLPTRKTIPTTSITQMGIGDLPEGCVAAVLSHLDPPDICRLATLNRAFYGASSADFVWESKLPVNYELLIDRVFDNPPLGLCMRDIYSLLCRKNDIDDGTKKVWLDKVTGKTCLSISSDGLSMTGIGDRRYWNRISTDESRFGKIAYLQQTWWLEVDGEVDFPFPPGTYSLFFRLQLGYSSKRFGRKICNDQHVHGWDIKPVQFKLSTSAGQEAISHVFFGETGKWIHHHVGDFVIDGSSEKTKIRFSMTQIDCTHTKGGLCIDSVAIYPKEIEERLKH
ncbi:F-box protein PP2-A12-like [Impatiens glandulifera]|uniref:F-box protein PP2-A12-like n=1 Tax=Impatiens glandulifera TaxID=253017 RepID=UPI001FB0D904|nr:F-box protein PP2-A12-like [Impatiens glandulifera]